MVICLCFWLACFLLGRFSFFVFAFHWPVSKLAGDAAQGHVSGNGYLHWEEEFRSAEGVALNSTWDSGCDIAFGRWVYDRQRKQPYNEKCRDIFKGWNCIRNQRPNAEDITAWRWQPWKCDLPQLNGSLFLERFQHKSIGFVGDSLNRNMFVSLVCTLKQVSTEVKKWRPVGADKAVTFLKYNMTLAYHRTNLLAHYGRWEAKAEDGKLESLGYKEGFRIDVDIPQSTWAHAPRFHDLYFVDTEMPRSGLKFLRTQSPRHFEDGHWNQNGTCHRTKLLLPSEVDSFFAPRNKGPNIEMHLVNQHLRQAVRGTRFQLLDISYMSSFRADAHPSKSAGKVHEDCMHWCLPGVSDFWNDILALELLKQLQ
eukprot:c17977_g1_i1 orf=1345-2445(+)